MNEESAGQVIFDRSKINEESEVCHITYWNV